MPDYRMTFSGEMVGRINVASEFAQSVGNVMLSGGMRYVAATVTLLFASACRADDLLVFSASWCGPCRQLHEAIERDPTLAEDYDVVEIDIEKEPELAKQHRVTSVPTLVACPGKGERRKVGWHGIDDLRRWLRSRKR